jgi:hypothetical protein
MKYTSTNTSVASAYLSHGLHMIKTTGEIFKLAVDIYRVSTTKRPDFGDVLKICKCFSSDVKSLPITTGVQISS